MIAGISHDVKTPLTSVLGYSESLLKKELPPERVRQYLSVIHSGARSIKATLEEFDGYIEGKLVKSLDRKDVSLSFITRMLMEEYENELRGQGVRFTVDNRCAGRGFRQCGPGQAAARIRQFNRQRGAAQPAGPRAAYSRRDAPRGWENRILCLR